ncbi:MAG: hypothetical protein ACRCXX_04030 [Cetobacterium sp.]|uniref:hypothetical protein n=1 Tax=Cetobacterium sp. TaxID=2071632 RepID=UPI003F2F16D0
MKINNVEWDDDFFPYYTPKEMLEMGIFGGKYMNDIKDQFPVFWFFKAKMVKRGQPKDINLNYFRADASLPLKDWQDKGWILEHDDHGWFQWYCNYFIGRRIPNEDRIQIERWRNTVRRHSAMLINRRRETGLSYPSHSQAILHWAWNPDEEMSKYINNNKLAHTILVRLKDKSEEEIKEAKDSKFVLSSKTTPRIRVSENVLGYYELVKALPLLDNDISIYKNTGKFSEFLLRVNILSRGTKKLLENIVISKEPNKLDYFN